MTDMKYGTLVRLSPKDDLATACEEKFSKLKEMGLESCQLVYKPKVYTDEDADIIKAAADKYGIEISAQFCGYYDSYTQWDMYYDFKLAGINSPMFGASRVEYLLSAIPFLKRLGITDMITHAGFVPNNPFSEDYTTMLCAVKLLGKKLAQNGLNLLFETGAESPISLLRLILDSGLDNLYVNLDTANIIMYGFGNPVDAMYTFGKYVRNVHAKDGLPPTDPKKYGQEVTIGTGYVDFDKVFKALYEQGYDRYITIERELSGGDKSKAIMDAIDYLKAKQAVYYN